MLRTAARVAAAALLAAAAYAAVPAPPASAAGCTTADGVTVVVDFHELGGGVQSGCIADGAGATAAELFGAAGFSLSYVQRQPGFVCRVDGVPADSPCVTTPPADAYWALYWSDGRSGSWTYATSGAGGLRVPDGGYVGFSWNGSSTRATPGYSPAPHPSATPTPSPTRTPSPSAHPSQHHSATPTPTTSASAGPSETPSAAPTKKPRDKKSRTPKPTAAETSTPQPTEESTSDAVPTSAEPTDPDGGGLPAWVAPAVIAVLFGGAAAAAVVRRRRGVPGA
ncbi:hypothetical protein [Nocardioides sp. SR21]|uniref:hypothetical protein n=1 Tax=Nocardioides sp. SR21 TaxID=2919501 RepID=UPI001FAA0BF9|nr:hypothetical protein [Nocardioides sp. SR21]